MPRTRIKICGIRDEESAIAAAEAGADAVGLVFVRSSPRCVNTEEAQNIMLALPPFVATVGVFMNHAPDTFAEIEEECPTTHAQLHGNENESIVRACGPAIKAVRYTADSIAADLKRWEACEDVEAILVDGPAPGEGVPFRWEDLAPHLDNVRKPVFLAGGLTPDNVAEAIRILRPYGVDVSSGVERERGVKDPALMEAFCQADREADVS